MKYKAILYDIDGTILDTSEMNFIPLTRIVEEELGYQMTYQEALRYVCYPGMKTLELLGIQDIETVYARWVKYVNEYEKGAILFDGFLDVFHHFKNHQIKQGIVSSKKRAQYEIDFVSKNLDIYIDAAVLEEDTSFHKPDPTPLLLCLEKLNIKAHEALYVGDAYSDFLAAKNAGMDFAYAKYGSHETQQIDATYTLDKPIDLILKTE